MLPMDLLLSICKGDFVCLLRGRDFNKDSFKKFQLESLLETNFCFVFCFLGVCFCFNYEYGRFVNRNCIHLNPKLSQVYLLMEC